MNAVRSFEEIIHVVPGATNSIHVDASTAGGRTRRFGEFFPPTFELVKAFVDEVK